MVQPSSEALLISALVNNGDVHEASRYGITADHFSGFAEEFSWVQNYDVVYGNAPSVDAFCDNFPDFPFKNHTDVRYSADRVLDQHYAKLFLRTAHEGIEAVQRGQTAEAFELIRKHEYAKTSVKPRDLTKDMAFLDSWDEPLRGLEVPYPTLQRATGGMRPGNLWYLAARLGQGKSAYLCDIAVHAQLAGKRVLYYSLEMSDNELRARTHSILARKFGYTDFTTLDILRRNVDLMSYKEFLENLTELVPGEMHFHTPAEGPVSPAVISSRADEYDLIVIDYATLMMTDSGEHASSDWRTATQISNRLKQVALAHNVPILAAAQINRDGEAGDLPPKIKNLAQADALGQDGDVVVTMRARAKNVASIFSLEKNRHGPSGMRWWTKFDVNAGVFEEISEDKAESLVIEAEMGEM